MTYLYLVVVVIHTVHTSPVSGSESSIRLTEPRGIRTYFAVELVPFDLHFILSLESSIELTKGNGDDMASLGG